MTGLSWTVVGAFLVLTFAVGLWFARRASKNTSEYFLSGRTLPWWIVGTSMVITTFAPDTPLGVAENVRTGVSYGWFGWNMVMGQILAVFLFSRLWRRSGVMTDNELLELRYSGRPAAGLRLYKACHFSILANLITLSVVISAMVTVAGMVTDIPPEHMGYVRWGIAGIALIYAVLAGFWGVVATDFIQFWVAVGGTAVFAWMASDQLGGMEAVSHVVASDVIAFFPDDPKHQLKVLAFMTIMWWGIYNADGGGYLCQRMLAAKNEWHASVGTLWFSIAYAAVRMWPWVAVGSLSLIVFPQLVAHEGEVLVNGRPASEVSGTVEVVGASGEVRTTEVAALGLRAESIGTRTRVVSAESGEEVRSIAGRKAYPGMMRRVLAGHPLLLGLLVAAFLAAFLSTVDTLLNWGASYLVNDVFRRFITPDASERKLVWTAKGSVVVIMIAAVWCSQFFQSIKDAWIFTWAVSAGIGPILIMRWFWWRVNAWSEICALSVSILVTLGFEICNGVWRPGGYLFAQSSTWVGGTELLVWHKALIVVGLSIFAALLAVRFGPETDRARLEDFVRLVRPPGWWGPIRARVGEAGKPDCSVRQIFVLWVLGVSLVYGLTFGVGGLIYGRHDIAVPAFVAFALASAGLLALLPQAGFRRKE